MAICVSMSPELEIKFRNYLEKKGLKASEFVQTAINNALSADAEAGSVYANYRDPRDIKSVVEKIVSMGYDYIPVEQEFYTQVFEWEWKDWEVWLKSFDKARQCFSFITGKRHPGT